MNYYGPEIMQFGSYQHHVMPNNMGLIAAENSNIELKQMHNASLPNETWKNDDRPVPENSKSSVKTIKKPYKCDVCFKAYKKPYLLREHQNSHTGNKPYECHICQKRIKTKKLLKAHLIVHSTNRAFKCDLCPRSFVRRTTLNVHMKVHMEKKPFECEICHKAFRFKSNLTNHSSIHTDIVYRCGICNRMYGNKQFFLAHKRFHSRADYGGPEASKTGTTEHLTVNEGEIRYKCKMCYKVFKKTEELETHKVMHSKKTHKESSLYKSSNLISNRSAKCELYGQSLPISSKMHKPVSSRKHEQYNVKCKICDQGFKHEYQLKVHKKIHLGMKSYTSSEFEIYALKKYLNKCKTRRSRKLFLALVMCCLL